MPGPLLAEAYSQARLDLDSLDKDIKKAKKVLEKAAKSFEKILKLELQLDTTSANNDLKEFKKKVNLLKSEIEKDAISISIDTKANAEDARAAGAEAARAAEAGFGNPEFTIKVTTKSSDKIGGVDGNAFDRFTNGEVVPVDIFLDPTYHVDKEQTQAQVKALEEEIQASISDMVVTADVTIEPAYQIDPGNSEAELAALQAEVEASITDATVTTSVTITPEYKIDAGNSEAELATLQAEIQASISDRTVTTDVTITPAYKIDAGNSEAELAALQAEVQASITDATVTTGVTITPNYKIDPGNSEAQLTALQAEVQASITDQTVTTDVTIAPTYKIDPGNSRAEIAQLEAEVQASITDGAVTTDVTIAPTYKIDPGNTRAEIAQLEAEVQASVADATVNTDVTIKPTYKIDPGDSRAELETLQAEIQASISDGTVNADVTIAPTYQTDPGNSRAEIAQLEAEIQAAISDGAVTADVTIKPNYKVDPGNSRAETAQLETEIQASISDATVTTDITIKPTYKTDSVGSGAELAALQAEIQASITGVTVTADVTIKPDYRINSGDSRTETAALEADIESILSEPTVNQIVKIQPEYNVDVTDPTAAVAKIQAAIKAGEGLLKESTIAHVVTIQLEYEVAPGDPLDAVLVAQAENKAMTAFQEALQGLLSDGVTVTESVTIEPEVNVDNSQAAAEAAKAEAELFALTEEIQASISDTVVTETVKISPEFQIDEEDPFAELAAYNLGLQAMAKAAPQDPVIYDIAIEPAIDTEGPGIELSARLQEVDADIRTILQDENFTQDITVKITATVENEAQILEIEAWHKALLTQLARDETITQDVKVLVTTEFDDIGVNDNIQLEKDLKEYVRIKQTSYKELKADVTKSYKEQREIIRQSWADQLTDEKTARAARNKERYRDEAELSKLLEKRRKMSKKERILSEKEEVLDEKGRVKRKRQAGIDEQIELLRTKVEGHKETAKANRHYEKLERKAERAAAAAARKEAAKTRADELTTIIDVKFKGIQEILGQSREIGAIVESIPNYVKTEFQLDGIAPVQAELLVIKESLEALPANERINFGITGENGVLAQIEVIDAALEQMAKTGVIQVETDGTITVLKQVEELKAALDSIADKKTTQIELDGVTQATTTIGMFTIAIDDVPDSKNTKFDVDGITKSMGHIVGYVAEIDAVPDKKTTKFDVDTDTNMFKNVFKLFKGLTDGIKGLFDGDGGGGGGGRGGGLVSKVSTAIGTFGTLSKGIVNSAQAGIGAVSGAVEATTTAVDSAKSGGSAFFESFKAGFNGMKEQATDTVAAISKVGGPIVQGVASAAALLMVPAMVTAALGAVGLLAGPIIAAIGGLVGAAIGLAVSSGIAIVAAGALPLLAVFLDETAKTKIMDMIKPLKEILITEFAGTTSLITNTIAPKFIEALTPLIGIASKGASDFIIPISNSLLGLVGSLGDVLKQAFDSGLVANIGEGIARLIDVLAGSMGGFVDIALAIGPPLTDLAVNVVGVLASLGTVFKDDIATSFQLLADLFIEVKAPLESFGSQAGGIITPVIELLARLIAGLVEVGANLAKGPGAGASIFDTLIEQLPALLKTIEQAGQFLVTIAPAFAAIIPSIQAMVSGFAALTAVVIAFNTIFVTAVGLIAKGAIVLINAWLQGLARVTDAVAWAADAIGLDSVAEKLRGASKEMDTFRETTGSWGDTAMEMDDGLWAMAGNLALVSKNVFGSTEAYDKFGKEMEEGRLTTDSARLATEAFGGMAAEGTITATDYANALAEIADGTGALAESMPLTTTYLKDWGAEATDTTARMKELGQSVKDLTIEIPAASTYIKAGVAEGAEQPAVEKIAADTIDIQQAIALQAEQVAAEVNKQNLIIRLKTTGLAPLANFIADLSPELVVSVIDQLGGEGSAAIIKANDEIAKTAATASNQLGNALALSFETATQKANQALAMANAETSGLTDIAAYFNGLTPDEYAAQFGSYGNMTVEQLTILNESIKQERQKELDLLTQTYLKTLKLAEDKKNEAIRIATEEGKTLPEIIKAGKEAEQKVLDDSAANAAKQDPTTAASTAAKAATDTYNKVFADNLKLAEAIENAIAKTNSLTLVITMATLGRQAANYFVATFQGVATTELALVDFGALFPANALFAAGSAGGSSFVGGFKLAVSIGIPLFFVDLAKGLVDTANWVYNVGDVTGGIYVGAFKVALALGIPLFFVDLAKGLVDTANWVVDAGIAAGVSWVGGFKVSLALSIPLFFVGLGTSLVETAGWAYPAGTAAGTSWTQGFGTQVLETIPLTMTFIANNVSILGAEKLAPSGTYLGTAVMDALALSLAANVQFVIDALAAVGLVLAFDTTWFSLAGGIMGITVMKTLAEAIAVEVGTATAAIELVAQAILEGFQNTVGPIGSVLGTVLAGSAETTAFIATLVGLAVAASLAKGFVEQIKNSATLMIGSVVTILQAVLRLGTFWTATGTAAGTAYAVGVSIGMLNFTALVAIINAGAAMGAAASKGLVNAAAEGLKGFANTIAGAIAFSIFFAGAAFTNQGKTIGYAIANGIAAGMFERLEALKQVAVAIGLAVAAAMREALQINSPSRVMSVIGGEVVEGLIVGMEASAPQLMQTAMLVGAALPTQVDAAASSAQTTFNQTTQVDKSTTQINNWNVTTNDSMMWAQRTERLLARRRP